MARKDFIGDPMTVARRLVGAYLCRCMSDGTVVRARGVAVAHGPGGQSASQPAL